MTFGVVVEPNKRNGKIWVASVPLLPGCNAMGSCMLDVLRKTEEAIRKYFQRRPRQFPTLPPNITCRMISKEEYAAMDDAPLGVPAVLVGAPQSELASR